MGRREHHSRGWKLRIRKIYTIPGHCQKAELALGCDSLYGEWKRMKRQELFRSVGSESQLILNKDSFYKTLTPEQSKLAFANEYDFDSPNVSCLEIPSLLSEVAKATSNITRP